MRAIVFGMAMYMLILVKKGGNLIRPDELLLYMNCIAEQNYKEMYPMIDVEAFEKSLRKIL